MGKQTFNAEKTDRIMIREWHLNNVLDTESVRLQNRLIDDTWENRLSIRKNRPHYDTGMAPSVVLLSLKQHFNTTYFLN